MSLVEVCKNTSSIIRPRSLATIILFSPRPENRDRLPAVVGIIIN